ncbi:hypothetical protein [Hymenobacter koreensis]|uniref:XRE family transcriptional regulator n=1 Tax=Hymenobacter koreensis TaxID=1084523 RepID=A0ABP8J5Z6_9BACT
MAKTTTVGQRFAELISHLGISKNAFAMSLDKTATVIQHIVEERNKPGFDLLCKVFEKYPNVSKDWLMQGVGQMLQGSAGLAVIPGAPSAGKITEAPAVAASAANVSTAATPLEAPIRVAAEVPTNPVLADAGATTKEVAPQEFGAPAHVAAAPAVPAVSWEAALYAQQLSHQLALAEMRNQHLLEQQRLMQQMVDLLQKQR